MLHKVSAKYFKFILVTSRLKQREKICVYCYLLYEHYSLRTQVHNNYATANHLQIVFGVVFLFSAQFCHVIPAGWAISKNPSRRTNHMHANHSVILKKSSSCLNNFCLPKIEIRQG